MRVASLYQEVQSPRLHVDIKYGIMYKEAIAKSEELSQNLQKRYSEIQSKINASSSTPPLPMPGKTVKANNSSNNIKNDSSKTVINNINNNGFKDDLSYVNNRRDDCNINQIDGDSVITPTIEPMELFDLILEFQKVQDGDFILLLDARKKEDFEASHISNLKTNRVKLLNIPEELLEKGTAATKLVKLLPSNAQVILKERRSARRVIIFDWQSTSYNENEHLDALFTALWKVILI